MTTQHQKLQDDIDRFRLALAQQERKDETHEVAIAMLRADLKRAEDKMARFMASDRPVTRRYVDGRAVA